MRTKKKKSKARFTDVSSRLERSPTDVSEAALRRGCSRAHSLGVKSSACTLLNATAYLDFTAASLDALVTSVIRGPLCASSVVVY